MGNATSSTADNHELLLAAALKASANKEIKNYDELVVDAEK